MGLAGVILLKLFCRTPGACVGTLLAYGYFEVMNEDLKYVMCLTKNY